VAAVETSTCDVRMHPQHTHVSMQHQDDLLKPLPPARLLHLMEGAETDPSTAYAAAGCLAALISHPLWLAHLTATAAAANRVSAVQKGPRAGGGGSSSRCSTGKQSGCGAKVVRGGGVTAAAAGCPAAAVAVCFHMSEGLLRLVSAVLMCADCGA
jgi:hypothetical protein